MTDFWIPDSRLHVPELLIPGQKPIGPVEVELAYVYAPSNFWLLNDIGEDLVTRKKLTHVGSHNLARNNFLYTGLKTGNYSTTQLITSDGTPFDFIVQLKFRGELAAVDIHPIFQWSNAQSDSSPFLLITFDASHRLRGWFDASYLFTDTVALSPWEWLTITVVGSANGDITFYKNEDIIYGPTDRGPLWVNSHADNKFWINNGYQSSNSDDSEYAHLGYWKDKRMPSDGILNIIRDPYQFLKSANDAPFPIHLPGDAAQSIQPAGLASAEAFGDASVSGGTQPVPADFYFIAADSRLLQPELLMPGRRPVEPVGINWRHKYAPGLVGAFLLDDDTNLVDEVKSGTLEGGAFLDPARGLVLDGSQQDEYFRFGANFRNRLAFGTDDFVLVVCATYGGDQNDYPTLISNGFNDAGEWVLAYDSGFDSIVFVGNASSVQVSAGILPPGFVPGQTFTVAVCRTGDTLKLYYDGEYKGQDTSAGADLSAVNDYAGLGIAETTDTADRYWNGAINFAFVWRSPTIGNAEALIRDISRDPYQILKPAADLPLLIGIPGGGPRTVRPTGIVSAETFGAHAIAPGAISLLPAGIATAEAHGATILDIIATLAPAAIPSAEALGDATLLAGAVSVDPAGIAGAEAFGSALISPGLVQILAQGVASAEALGTATVTRGTVSIDPAGIVSAEAFGAAGVLSGGALIAAFGIDSAEAVGALVVQPGAASVIPSGIATGEAFGAHDIARSAILLAPAGITSGEWFGDTLVIPQLTVIEPAGVDSGEAFGTLTLVGGAHLLGWLMAEIQARAALDGAIGAGSALTGAIDTPPGLGADIRINWDG